LSRARTDKAIGADEFGTDRSSGIEVTRKSPTRMYPASRPNDTIANSRLPYSRLPLKERVRTVFEEA